MRQKSFLSLTGAKKGPAGLETNKGVNAGSGTIDGIGNELKNDDDDDDDDDSDEDVNNRSGSTSRSGLAVENKRGRRLVDETKAEVVPPYPVTVKPGPQWQLVYVGHDTQYICEGIVPLEALYREGECYDSGGVADKLSQVPRPVIASASFCVQTEGTEFPIQEHSRLSNPAKFWTRHDVGPNGPAVQGNWVSMDTSDSKLPDDELTATSGEYNDNENEIQATERSELQRKAKAKIEIPVVLTILENDVPTQSPVYEQIVIKLKEAVAKMKIVRRQRQDNPLNADEWTAKQEESSSGLSIGQEDNTAFKTTKKKELFFPQHKVNFTITRMGGGAYVTGEGVANEYL